MFIALLKTVLGWSETSHVFPKGVTLEGTKEVGDSSSFSQRTLHPAVQELKTMIEEDPELYMGFHQMFEQIPDKPKYRVDPTGNPQVSLIIFCSGNIR